MGYDTTDFKTRRDSGQKLLRIRDCQVCQRYSATVQKALGQARKKVITAQKRQAHISGVHDGSSTEIASSPSASRFPVLGAGKFSSYDPGDNIRQLDLF